MSFPGTKIRLSCPLQQSSVLPPAGADTYSYLWLSVEGITCLHVSNHVLEHTSLHIGYN